MRRKLDLRSYWLAAGVIGASVLGPPVAIADDCPAPTVEQCYENPLLATSYWQADACGIAQRPLLESDPSFFCNQTFRTQSQLPLAFAPAPTSVAVPASYREHHPGMNVVENACVMRHSAPDADPVLVRGLSSSFVGAQTLWGSQKVASGLLDDDAAFHIVGQAILDREAWAANGLRVDGCEEYVYERWYDYSKFADDAFIAGDDYRSIFNVGMERLYDGVNSKSGTLVATVPVSPGKHPKNVYFTYKDEYPPDTDALHHVWSADATALGLPQKLQNTEGTKAYYHSLSWHQRMNQALGAGADDAMLYALADKQREFAKLLAERAAIMKRWTDYADAMGTSGEACNRAAAPGIPWPWLAIINPAQQVLDGYDVLQYYAGNAFDTVAQPAPLSLQNTFGYGVGVFSTPLMQYGSLLIETNEALAMDATNEPALQMMTQLQSATGEELSPGETLIEEPVPADEEALGPYCDGYFGTDGLPIAVAGSCSSLVRLAGCAQRARDAVAAALAEVDAKIETALLEIAPFGCLNLDHGIDIFGGLGATATDLVPSRCDWNPELFANEMSHLFERERERDFQECKAATGGVFGAMHPIRSANATYDGDDAISTPQRAALVNVTYLPAGDYTVSSDAVLWFIKMVTNWATSMDFQRDPVTRRPISGHEASDSDSLGNKLFGVEYGYDMGWHLGNLPLDPPTDPTAWCEASLSAHGRAYAKAHVFSEPYDLFDGEASVTSARDGDGRTVHEMHRISLFGADILPHDEDASMGTSVPPMVFHVSREDGVTHEVASFTFVVAGIPVTVRAGVAGRVGFDFDAQLAVKNACPTVETSITGQIKPWSSLDVYVSGGANVAVAEVGLRVDLTLLRLDLPLTLRFALQPSPSGNAQMIYAYPQLDLALTALSGRLRAYVDFVIGPTLYVTLFTWPGVQVANGTIFKASWHYPLARVALGLRALGGSS